jgi:putative glutamine amidotransferase
MVSPPRIGIDLDLDHDGRRWVYKNPATYHAAVVRAGGIPAFLCPDDPRPVPDLLEDLDGVLMTGGDDIHPHFVGRLAGKTPMTLLPVRRERFVLQLARVIWEKDIPCLAVCLGSQALNLASGGDLVLDLPSEYPGALDHSGGKRHIVIPEPQSFLGRYWKMCPQRLKSHHHQAARRLGQELVLEARGEDGVIEAFRHPGKRFLFGVQWHPELQYGSLGGHPLLEALIRTSGGQDLESFLISKQKEGLCR